jgi:hypothetical protein
VGVGPKVKETGAKGLGSPGNKFLTFTYYG